MQERVYGPACAGYGPGERREDVTVRVRGAAVARGYSAGGASGGREGEGEGRREAVVSHQTTRLRMVLVMMDEQSDLVVCRKKDSPSRSGCQVSLEERCASQNLGIRSQQWPTGVEKGGLCLSDLGAALAGARVGMGRQRYCVAGRCMYHLHRARQRIGGGVMSPVHARPWVLLPAVYLRTCSAWRRTSAPSW